MITKNFFYKYLSLIFFLFLAFIFLSCDKEVTKSPVEPEPNSGKIIIASNPSGFLVYLNGRNSGAITPDSLTFLDPAVYNVTLKRKQFKDTTITIDLAEDQEIYLNVDLLNNPSMYGKISLNSVPQGAEIFFNDSATGRHTPYTFSGILPGEYKLKLTLFQHRSESFSAIVSSSNTSSYTKTLTDTSVWVDYQTTNSDLASNNLSCIAIDNFGNKWIGSFDNGLIKFDGLHFENFNKLNSGLHSNRVLTISIDNQNRIWIGTDNGLAVFDGVSWIVYDKTNSGLRSNEILSIKFGNSNEVWIGAYTGLYKFDGVNWTRYNDAQLSIWANDLAIDNNNVWIATTKGIVKLYNGNLEYYIDTVYNYPTKNISAVEKDIIGNIWFGHLNYENKRNGLSYFDGSKFNNIYFGSTANAINHIFIDQNNFKWISTNEGLARLSNINELFVYTKINSKIISEKVSSSAMDNNGVLWITTFYSGLNKFKISSK